MSSCPNYLKNEAFKKLADRLGFWFAYSAFEKTKGNLTEEDVDSLILEKENQLKTEAKETLKEIKQLSKEITDSFEESKITNLAKEYFQVVSRILKTQPTVITNLFEKKEGNRLVILKKSLDETLRSAKTGFEQLEKKVFTLIKGVYEIENIINPIKDILYEYSLKEENITLKDLSIVQKYIDLLETYSIFLQTASESFVNFDKMQKKIGALKNEIDNLKSMTLLIDKATIVPLIRDELTNLGSPVSLIEDLEVLEKELSAKEKRNASEKSINKTKKEINKIKELIKLRTFIENDENSQKEINQRILDYLHSPDTEFSFINFWIKAFEDSSDPTILGFSRWFNNLKNKTNIKAKQFRIKYESILSKILSSYELINPYEVNKKISFVDKIYKKGNEEPVGALRLLRPFKDYEYELSKLIDEKSKAYSDWIDNKTPENEERYKKAKDDLNDFEEKVMFREFTQEYYDKFKLFKDDIGIEAKRRLDDLYAKREEAFFVFGNDILTDEQRQVIKKIDIEIAALGNLNNLDGTEKEDEEKLIAERILEIRKINSEIFEYVPSYTFFEKAKEEYITSILTIGLPYIDENNQLSFKKIDIDSQDYIDAINKWQKENTRIHVFDSFYKKRDLLNAELNLIYSKIKKSGDSSLKDLYKKMIDLTYGFRDEYNQPMGFEISEEKAKKIKNIQEEIENIKNFLKESLGLTEEEYKLYTLYEEKEKDGTLSFEEQLEYMRMLEKQLSFKKENYLSEIDKKRIKEIIEELNELQSNLPTEYYVEAFNNISSKYGTVIDNNGYIESTDSENNSILIDVLESYELDKLLKNPDFSSWFYKNHIQVLVYDQELKEKVLKWRRTYQWSKIIPNDPNDYEFIPSREYSLRRVRNEKVELARLIKKEQNKEELTKDELFRLKLLKKKEKYKGLVSYVTEKIEGETVDIFGNFLPDLNKKETIEKYKNENYFALKNSNTEEGKRLFKLLQIYTEMLEHAEKNTPFNQKKTLMIPSFRKSSSESFFSIMRDPKKFLKEIYKGVSLSIEKLISFEEGEGSFEQDELNLDLEDFSMESFREKYNKNYIEIPLKGNSYIEPDKISYDFLRSISLFNQSSEMNKVLRETLPVVNSLKRIVFSGNDKRNKKKKFDSRLAAIDHIIKKDFEGRGNYLDLESINNKKISDVIISAFNISKSLAGSAVMKFNVISVATNYTKATLDNFINSGNKYFSISDWFFVRFNYFIDLMNAISRDALFDTKNEESWQGQLLDAVQPVMDIDLEKEIGKYSKPSEALRMLNILSFIEYSRSFTEFNAQVMNWLAYMKAIKIEQDINGSKKVISYYEAWEKDENGFLKLKNGIDEKWDVNGKEFNNTVKNIHAINRKTHGNYRSLSQPVLASYASGQMVLFLKKFFIDNFINLFGAEGSFIDYISFKGRDYLNGYPRGYFYHTVQYGIKAAKNAMVLNSDFTTESDKVALGKTLKAISVIAFLKVLIEVVLGYSGDDKNKKENLSKYKNWQFSLLFLLERVLSENLTWFSPKNYLSLSSDILYFRGLLQWVKFMESFISQEEYKSTIKDVRGKTVHKKRDKKYKTELKKALGINSLYMQVNHPDQALKNWVIMNEKE